MVISDVKALFELVTQASSFITQAQVGWYKRSAELDAFKDHVKLLSERRLQWTIQLQRHGISGDEFLLRAMNAAINRLNQEHQYVKKLERNPLLRLRKRVFPNDLSYAVNRVLEIVNAGPQLLTERVLTSELLEKAVAQSPVRLPFIPDPKYVLLSDSFLEVQQALENEEAPRVMTVYGAAGIGKSSLAKYVALHYQEQKTSAVDSMESSLQKTATFPNGVQYLLCGLGANKRVKQLLVELLDNLGFGTGSTPLPNDFTTTASEAAGIQDGEYFAPLRSYRRRLQSRLAEQKLLIILDDLWEMEVLKDLLVPAKGVRYLITSQNREIWRDAEQIQLKNPTMAEARKIMANHTRGLTRKGEFPGSIQGITDAIVRELGYHPLSLATVGISIRKATDATHWEERRTHLRALLENNGDAPNGPPAYERPYPLTVGASIRLMEECISPAALQFLYLMALLSNPAGGFMGPGLRKDLVQFFYACVQRSRSSFEYKSLVEYLEDRSLVESRNEGAEGVLVAHSLRIQHMQGRRNLELKNLGAQIVGGSGDQHVEPIQNGEQESLVVIMSAIHFGEPFLNLVATKFSDLYNARAINDGISPRIRNAGIDEVQLVRGARYHLSHVLSSLYSLISPGGEDEGVEIWKQQAYEHARKIIIKLVCRGKLDDSSMAQLFQLSQTTSIACAALWAIISVDTVYYDLRDRNVTFSSVYPKTMNTLLALLHSKATKSQRQAAAISALSYILRFEKEDTIVNVTEIWKELLAMDSKPLIQIACMDAFENSPTSYTTPEVWKRLVTLLVNGKDSKVRRHAGRTIWSSDYEPTALTSQTEHFPDSIKMLLTLFSSQDTMRNAAGRILVQLSSSPENRIKLTATQGGLQGLVDILANVEVGYQDTTHCNFRKFAFSESSSLWRPAAAARILGNLALTKEFGDTNFALPGVVEGLLILQALEMGMCWMELGTRIIGYDLAPNLFHSSTRTLAILHSRQADPRLKDPPPWSQVLEAYGSGGCRRPVQEAAYFIFYVSRVDAHLEIGSYRDALADLDLAEDRLNQVPEGERYMYGSRTAISLVRYMKIYVRALLGDYVGALGELNSNLENIGPTPHHLMNKAWLRRLSGDLSGALDDLNEAMILSSQRDLHYPEDDIVKPREYKTFGFLKHCLDHYEKRDVLRHRSYVKCLIGDNEGAKEDAKSSRPAIGLFCSFFCKYLNMETLPELPRKYTDHLFESPFIFINPLP